MNPNDRDRRLRTLVVDDERHGRDVVRHMLAPHRDFVVIGECENGDQAIEDIRILRPDVLFLDVEMPGRNGVELIAALRSFVPPAVVFVTAHDTYAVQAFDRCALDYLTKPFLQERFERTLARIRALFTSRNDAALGRKVRDTVLPEVTEQPASTPSESGSASDHGLRSAPLGRFVIKEAGRMFFVPVEDVDYLEASGNYVALHAAKKTHLLHDTLANVEKELDPRRFLRIHRSTIVNVSRIRELESFTNGELVVVLNDSTKLKLSRTYRDLANQVLRLT